MSTRAWAITTLVFGAGTLLLFVVFALLPEMRAAAQCLPVGSVVRFELARDGGELAALFGGADSVCRPLAAAAMDAVNRLDLIVFIPTYTAFCVSAAFLMAGGALRPLSAAAGLFALAAAGADYVETTTLLEITPALNDLTRLQTLAPISSGAAWAKFALLTAHAFACAGLAFVNGRRWIITAALVAPVAGVALAASDPAHFSTVMNAAFALAWTALLAAAVRELARKRA